MAIGNEESHELDINNAYGRKTGIFIGVEYVWFKIKNKQLLCTENEYKSNFEFIKAYMNPNSSEYSTINAESVDIQQMFYLQEYHKFLSNLNPPRISKVVSLAIILPIQFVYKINII